MNTPLGRVIVLVNGEELECDVKKLPNLTENFCVDGRYKIICNKNIKTGKTLDIRCVFLPKDETKLKPCVETDENLALVSFYIGAIKFSIGTMGDIDGIQYKYIDNGLQIITKLNFKEIVFYIAWVEMNDVDKEDIYTWFAADPSYDINY